MKKIIKNKNGYAILELLFYISFFTVLALVVVSAMVTMTRSFRETSIIAEWQQGANVMERISREIKQATSIASLSAADLILNTKDNSDVDKTMEFKFVSPNVQFWDNGASVGNLNSPGITVTSLVFTSITTLKSKAVKMVMTIRSNNDKSNRTVDFYDTIVLRGSYQP